MGALSDGLLAGMRFVSPMRQTRILDDDFLLLINAAGGGRFTLPSAKVWVRLWFVDTAGDRRPPRLPLRETPFMSGHIPPSFMCNHAACKTLWVIDTLQETRTRYLSEMAAVTKDKMTPVRFQS